MNNLRLVSSVSYVCFILRIIGPHLTLGSSVCFWILSINVFVPKNRVTNLHQGYEFIEFISEEDTDYAIKVLNMIKLHGKPTRLNKVSFLFLHLKIKRSSMLVLTFGNS